MELIKDIIAYAIIFVIVILINFFVATVMIVSGESMEPNFDNKDFIIIEKISPKVNKIKRFDVVSVDLNESKNVIKRVIALPGETIEYKDNILYINDKKVEESFEIKSDTPDISPITLKNNEYYIIGDNREYSVDSRKYGPITKDKIIGKKIIRLWPLKKGI